MATSCLPPVGLVAREVTRNANPDRGVASNYRGLK
jgi:hypothetical protein